MSNLNSISEYVRHIRSLENQIIRLNQQLLNLEGEKVELKREVDTLQSLKGVSSKPNDGTLFDNLKVGDVLQIKKGFLTDNYGQKFRFGTTVTVKYVDKISQHLYIEGKDWSGTVGKDGVNQYAVKIGDAVDPSKKYPVLEVTKVVEQEVFLWHYDETPRDRRYKRYCERLGRDYPQKKIWDKTEKLSVDEDQLINWLKEVIRLKPEMGERVLGLFIPQEFESKEIPGHQDT